MVVSCDKACHNDPQVQMCNKTEELSYIVDERGDVSHLCWAITVDICQPQTSGQAIPFLWSGVGGCKNRTVAKMSGAVVAKAPQFPVRGATMIVVLEPVLRGLNTWDYTVSPN